MIKLTNTIKLTKRDKLTLHVIKLTLHVINSPNVIKLTGRIDNTHLTRDFGYRKHLITSLHT
jgi:hypothetical protein